MSRFPEMVYLGITGALLLMLLPIFIVGSIICLPFYLLGTILDKTIGDL